MLCNCLQLLGKLESECVNRFFFFKGGVYSYVPLKIYIYILRRSILLCSIVFLNSNWEEGRKEIWRLSYLLY